MTTMTQVNVISMIKDRARLMPSSRVRHMVRLMARLRPSSYSSNSSNTNSSNSCSSSTSSGNYGNRRGNVEANGKVGASSGVIRSSGRICCNRSVE